MAIGYQGNWRDIFQNWEALLHSYPLYIESVISKFLSASTVDGHNPYRITNEGIDWEIPEDGSWGNYGYWGDHQIVYLHRLLDAAHHFHPGLLESMIDRRSFSYADVPYRLHPYEDLVRDPKHTLDFDEMRQGEIDERVADFGADGRLVPTADGSGVHLATLAEKLLVPALAKLSNLVAGGGIWMNTQRPEWNDANNTLVGNGVSVVTLLHLRDYLTFIDRLLARTAGSEIDIGDLVVTWLRELTAAFAAHDSLLSVEPDAINDDAVSRGSPEPSRQSRPGLRTVSIGSLRRRPRRTPARGRRRASPADRGRRPSCRRRGAARQPQRRTGPHLLVDAPRTRECVDSPAL